MSSAAPDPRFDADEGEGNVQRLREIIAAERARGQFASKKDIAKAQARLRALGASEEEPAAAAAEEPDTDIGESLLQIRAQLLQHRSTIAFIGATPSTPSASSCWSTRRSSESNTYRYREWRARCSSGGSLPIRRSQHCHGMIATSSSTASTRHAQHWTTKLQMPQMQSPPIPTRRRILQHSRVATLSPLHRSQFPCGHTPHSRIGGALQGNRAGCSLHCCSRSVVCYCRGCDSLTSSEAALHALAPSANPPTAASSIASSVINAMAAAHTSDVVLDAVLGQEREAECAAQQRAAAAEAQQQQMQMQFHQMQADAGADAGAATADGGATSADPSDGAATADRHAAHHPTHRALILSSRWCHAHSCRPATCARSHPRCRR